MANLTRLRLTLGLLGLVVAVAVVAGGIRMKQVHDYGWEWTLFPSAAPPKIQFEGRDYDRGGEQSGAVPRGYLLKGETLGEGEIYKFGLNRGTSTVIFVKDGRRVYAYGLMGGP